MQYIVIHIQQQLKEKLIYSKINSGCISVPLIRTVKITHQCKNKVNIRDATFNPFSNIMLFKLFTFVQNSVEYLVSIAGSKPKVEKIAMRVGCSKALSIWRPLAVKHRSMALPFNLYSVNKETDWLRCYVPINTKVTWIKTNILKKTGDNKLKNTTIHKLNLKLSQVWFALYEPKNGSSYYCSQGPTWEVNNTSLLNEHSAIQCQNYYQNWFAPSCVKAISTKKTV